MNLNERIGAAIQKAASELPEGYSITFEVERDSGGVNLFIPPHE